MVGDNELPPLGKFEIPQISQSIEEYFSISPSEFYLNYLSKSSFWESILSTHHFNVKIPPFCKSSSPPINPFDNFFVRRIEFKKSLKSSGLFSFIFNLSLLNYFCFIYFYINYYLLL